MNETLFFPSATVAVSPIIQVKFSSHCGRCFCDDLHDVGPRGDVGKVTVPSLQLLRQPTGGKGKCSFFNLQW